jgi:acyl dehydratase
MSGYPELIAQTTAVQLFCLSAATSNSHRIHYDVEWAKSEGHRERVVHGWFVGELLVGVIRHSFAGHSLLHLEYRNLRSAFCGDALCAEIDDVQVATVMDRQATQVRATVRSDESAIAAGRAVICNSPDLPADLQQRREWIAACVGQWTESLSKADTCRPACEYIWPYLRRTRVGPGGFLRIVVSGLARLDLPPCTAQAQLTGNTVMAVRIKLPARLSSIGNC